MRRCQRVPAASSQTHVPDPFEWPLVSVKLYLRFLCARRIRASRDRPSRPIKSLLLSTTNVHIRTTTQRYRLMSSVSGGGRTGVLDLCYNILQHPGSRCSARDLLIQHRSPILTAGSTLDFARHWQAKLLYLSPCCCDAAAESSAATNVVGRAEHVGDAGAGPRVEAPAHWRRHPARNCHERHAEDNVTASQAQVSPGVLAAGAKSGQSALFCTPV